MDLEDKVKMKNRIEQEIFYPGGFYTAYTCELDCKCKDFKRKGAESHAYGKRKQ